jgi:hypothetical protein
VNDELTIIADDTYTFCSVTNTLGQLLAQPSLNNGETKVNVSMLPAGLYYITLTGNNGSVVRKFVRQ